MGTVSDGGRAIQDALSQVHGQENHQRDVWHLFHVASQVQGRLDRAVKTEHDRLAVIGRQAEGKRARGRRPKATLTQQKALVAQISSVADGVRYLCQQWHTLLEVVVPYSDRLLSSDQRQGEIEALLDLLDELVPSATPPLQSHIQMLSKQIRLALPQTLLFARRLDALQEQASRVLGSEAVALVAWAWLRRAVLGPTSKHLLQGLNPAWRAVASELLAAWDQAVRASSAVENWHSILRLVCSLCSLFGIITALLLVVFMRSFPPYNGRDRPHPIPLGWQLWAILPSPPDCSIVSHGFEPCLKKLIRWVAVQR